MTNPTDHGNRLVDLTMPFSESITPVPGHPLPELTAHRTLENDGIRSTRAHIMLHSGTHIDAPYHVIEDGATIDAIPLDRFHRPALRIDLSSVYKPGQPITAAMLKASNVDLDEIEGHIVALATGWCDRSWRSQQLYAENPYLGSDAAEALAAARPSALAIDFSVDHGRPWPNHQTLLGNDVLLIENLMGLTGLPERGFWITAFPLRLVGENGSPARVVAHV